VEQDVARPAILREGDLVMVVSPAGPMRPERLEVGIGLLTDWGLRVTRSPNVHARAGFLAGADELRLADLNLALREPEVRAVICTRGGYGVQRIVDGLDMAAVRADPKLVVGFSDITALQLALWRGARLPTLHGPGAAWAPERTGPVSAESLRRALMTGDPIVLAARPDQETSPVRVGGVARGTLLGGNLSLLVSTVGTIDMPDLTGAILLIEEVDESPHKVDRMLLHLRRAGALTGLAGVAIGHFTQCVDDGSTSIVDVLYDQLGRLGVPLLGGLPVGHGTDQLTVALGVSSTLDADAGTLTVDAAGTPPA
jgi:muramoyltetrapeptide carboxypeptidase